MLKPISQQRYRIEHEGHHHVVRRGWLMWLHWENMPWLETVFKWLLICTGFWRRGFSNVLNTRVNETEVTFANLPAAFDGFQVLWISDLHIDPLDGLCEKLCDLVQTLEYDICVLGGDYCFQHTFSDVAARRMKQLAAVLTARSDVYAILGNHDQYSMAQVLDESNVRVLINEHVILNRDGESLALIGIDDHHYYGADDLAAAMNGLDADAFKVLLCHSPEMLKKGAKAGADFYIAGHTHAGQVCLPNGFAPVTCCSVPRRFIKGSWQYKNMKGYTSRGAGASGVAVRFNCPPEIALLTLKHQWS
ncbi:MAG: metallophosphoesterase [Planctomycetota bacterium]|jgi:predicted MPP superfamily phosphohydrolase